MPCERRSLIDHQTTSTKPKYIESEAPYAGRPRFPRNFSSEAKRVFKRLVSLLEARKVLTEGDVELLRLYALNFERHEQALAKIREQGMVCLYERLDKHGAAHQFEKRNEHLKIAEDCERFMRACLADLGLSPSSRGKITPAFDPKTPKPLTPEEQALLSREAEQPPVEDEIDLDSIDETQVM
jgi:P27 family predicted phage terminase small subunit